MLDTGEYCCIGIGLHPQGFSEQNVFSQWPDVSSKEQKNLSEVLLDSAHWAKLTQQKEAGGKYWVDKEWATVSTQNKGGANQAEDSSWHSPKGIPESAL
jgi:hypothetical protein